VSLTLTITGTEALKAALKRVSTDTKPVVAAALYQEAEVIMADAKANYVPVDHGPLRASGFVQPPKAEGADVSVTMGFGGSAKAYAIAVHEHLSEHSPRSWRIAEAAGRRVQFSPSGAGPKYLERPLLAAAKHVANHISDRIRGSWR
jgi:hypothetical protein